VIVVKLELWPLGDESRRQDLGTAHIANEGGDDNGASTYSVRLLKGAKYSTNPGSVWKLGKVVGFPRASTQVGPWELLFLALESALGSRVGLVRRLCGRGQRSSVPIVGLSCGRSPICRPGVVCSHDGPCSDSCGGDHYYHSESGECLRCGAAVPE
jgi:hypothetical protein